MKLLVVGKGGREHALITAIANSPTETDIYSFPGSDAIAEFATVVDVDGLDGLIDWMVAEKVDLCVAGEESYLLKGEGLANRCKASGIPCWGPEKRPAHLEGSKEFAKKFMMRHGIPTGAYQAVETAEEAKAAISGYPTVLKFDGLAAGKGVAVCADESTADGFLSDVMVDRKFGPGRMVVEEFLEGPELSVFVSVVDGDYHILALARDYKRIGDGDAGLNTGGRGAVSSLHLVDDALRAKIEDEVVKPTVAGLQKDEMGYRGFLYFGLMLTADGPKIIEYNCRFGDPECQAVMPLVTGDFAAYVYSAAKGELQPGLIGLKDEWSICVILASAGYPESSRSGDMISGLGEVGGARVYHAGTKLAGEGVFETHGGRVLAVVAQGESRNEAREKVYREADKVSFDGMQRRSDIGQLHFED
ncbi:MAG: phosphoribosylamine--glycine ligase [Verrucomicrobiales bacterium]|nr:phosphoribosylamine--glycine ligase [Verrucomicrobiales bacterium]